MYTMDKKVTFEKSYIVSKLIHRVQRLNFSKVRPLLDLLYKMAKELTIEKSWLFQKFDYWGYFGHWCRCRRRCCVCVARGTWLIYMCVTCVICTCVTWFIHVCVSLKGQDSCICSWMCEYVFYRALLQKRPMCVHRTRVFVCARVMSHIHMCHVTNMNESRHTSEWVMSHI